MSGFASCCVLSYERPRFLRTAITTLLENAGAPLELIVHDDGSERDRGLLYHQLHGLVEHGVISTLITNPPGHNQGQGVALNRMFSIARGNPILKLDQDLSFRPGWLARVRDTLRMNAIQGDEPRIGLLGLFHYHHEPVDCAETELGRYGHGELAWEQHTHICGSGFAVTRECWKALGPFAEHSESFSEDWTFQNAVTGSGRYCCALPADVDLVDNCGFGIGPSTVVIGRDKVAAIHKEPVIHGA